ncbi:MAG TPA: hypothetical protein VH299_14630 [Solirubrobacterales bacterium]|jgi:hypothetical protein|nr:hypothetical protein [Solirubrobacterales bacterium]
MKKPGITEVEAVNITEERDGLYVFSDSTDGRRFAAAAETAGHSCIRTTEPIFVDPVLVDELIETVAEGLEWPESLIGRLVEDDDGRRFAALSLDTKEGRWTVGDDTDWEYADDVRVVAAEATPDPEPS